MEEAAEIKGRADKRLRAIARDVAAELAALGVGVDLGTGELMAVMPLKGRVEGGRGNGPKGAIVGQAIVDAIDAIDNRAT